MFSSRSHAPQPKPHTLTTIPAPDDTAQRRARHLALAQELTELGMGLARTAARRAHTLFAEEEAAPKPDPEPEPRPATHTAPLTPAQSHAFTFARLASVVRLAATFEARVAADAFAPQHAATRAAEPGRPDARRPLLRQALHDAAAAEANPARLRRAIDARVEHELAADPEAATPVWNLLEAISQDMALTLDLPRLPDDCLPPALDDDPPFDVETFHALVEADWQSRAPPN